MKIQFRTVDSFSPEENQELWSLIRKSYKLSYDDFIAKQKTLDQYALYYSENNDLVGFTGIRDHSFRVNNQKYRAIYFGQTVIDKHFRGKNLIQNTVIKLILRHFMRFKRAKLIVWNDAISYRPYLVMARNLKSFYPNRIANEEVEAEHVQIRDVLGMHYYESSYDPQSGTVKKEKSTLEESELLLSEKDLSEPNIQYYVSKNPNFVQGHGLITFCPATMSNLLFYLTKRFRRHA